MESEKMKTVIPTVGNRKNVDPEEDEGEEDEEEEDEGEEDEGEEDEGEEDEGEEEVDQIPVWGIDTKQVVKNASSVLGSPLRAISQGDKFLGTIEWTVNNNPLTKNIHSVQMHVIGDGKFRTKVIVLKSALADKIADALEKKTDLLASSMRQYYAISDDKITVFGNSLDGAMFALHELLRGLKNNNLNLLLLKRKLQTNGLRAKLQWDKFFEDLNQNLFK
jgi:hypothetical protein